MSQTQSPTAVVGRRGLFAGLTAAVGIVALATGARKIKAKAQAKLNGPVLYRRTEEVDRYFKSMY